MPTLDEQMIRMVNLNIQDFNTFLIKNVPYGRVNPTDVTQGMLEIQSIYDKATPAEPLRWYFGGKAYEVGKAIRIPYSYKFTDYGGEATSASLFVGYEHLPEWEWRRKTPWDPAAAHAANRKEYEEAAESDPSIRNLTSTQAITVRNYNDWILQQMPCNLAPQDNPNYVEFLDQDGQKPRPYTYGLVPDRLQYVTGIARDNDADHPFTLTFEDITAFQGRYDQLIHWPFGGKVYRITKAIRIPFTVRYNKAAKASAEEWAKDAAGKVKRLGVQAAPELTEADLAARALKRRARYIKAPGSGSLFIAYQGGGIHPGP